MILTRMQMETLTMNQVERALALLETLGFKRNPHQAYSSGGMGGELQIRFEHVETGTEFALTMSQWLVLEPFFSSGEAEAASQVGRLRLAAEKAVAILEKRMAPEQQAAEALRDALR